MKEERAVGKKMKKITWYGSRFQSVLFVQSSPGEVLKKEVQKVIDESGFKVRVVEQGGEACTLTLAKIRCGPST